MTEVGDHQGALDAMETQAAAEAGVSDDALFGQPGRAFDRRSPYYVGLVGTLGAATGFGMVWSVFAARQILILLGLAFFLALGLDPAVTWLYRRRLPRWAAVIVVLLAALGALAAFLGLAVPVVVDQVSQLAHQVPHYLRSLNNPHSNLGKLNFRYHLVANLQKFIGSGGSSLAGGVVGVGKAVLGVVSSIIIVMVVAVYLLADLPRVKRGLYHLAPRTRRARMVLLTDEIFGRVGGYVLGNLLISVISGVGTFVWAWIFGIPYALLLGLLVGLFDLIPVIGSTIGGVIVALVALTVSLPVAIATAAFYIVYRFLEDYFLTPKVMGRTVDVPGLVTVIATLVGGALLGIIGALVAIPVAAGLKLLLQEILAPRLDRS